MHAAVFHTPKRVSYESVPDPTLTQPGDAIVRVTATSICGSDLHIYNGLFPQLKPLVLGHEFMGVVEEVGTGVTRRPDGLAGIAHLLNGRASARRERERRDHENSPDASRVSHGGFFNRP